MYVLLVIELRSHVCQISVLLLSYNIRGLFQGIHRIKVWAWGSESQNSLMTVILLVGGLFISFFCYLPVSAFCHEVQLAVTLLTGHVPGHQGCIIVL